jgi:hypothetical protein
MTHPEYTAKLIARFWPKVNKRSGHFWNGTECWAWVACRTRFGHGLFGVQGKNVGAHRVSYELAYGPIPAALWVLHRCDNPWCVRPEHLFLGTALDNNRDRHEKGRYASGDRHPARLHPEKFGDPHLLPNYVAPRGESHGNAKLTDELVRTIRRLSAEGMGYATIAARINSSKSNVARVVRRQRWTHVA